MARLLLLPCVLALGCSEYGFVSPGPSTSEAPDTDPPSSPPDPPSDTDPPVPGRELDCERASKVVVHELSPLFGSTDFDADGWALFVGAGDGPGERDIWRGRLDLSRERITDRGSPYTYLRWPRLLPDGNLVYVELPPIGEAHDDLQRIGMWDRILNREVALTGGVQIIRAIEPDVDGTIYALHYGEPRVDGTPQAEVRWYDLYTGAERTVIRFDQPVSMVHNHGRSLRSIPELRRSFSLPRRMLRLERHLPA